MQHEPLALIGVSDISGRVRGKAVPASDLPVRIRQGIGWTPTNVMITAFGPIGDTPFRGLGDILMLPAPETEVKVDFGPDALPEHFLLADIVNTDGTPWDCCLRTFAKRAVAALKDAAGLRVRCAFEQEFVYSGAMTTLHNGYSFDAFRRQGAFGGVFVHALKSAGAGPECFLPEYAPGQFEVTCDPAIGVAAADRAVIIRELARAYASRFGQRVLSSPTRGPSDVWCCAPAVPTVLKQRPRHATPAAQT